jgi:tRNA threonylcarbamoyladenosine biosynthesis protein TsaB
VVVLLLGFDTATPAVTVAVHDGVQPLAQLVTVDAHRHAELLMPAIAKVIADAGVSRTDLTAVVVGIGPGPYTGLRVGMVTAKVLAAALGIPVYGICTHDVIAVDAVASSADAHQGRAALGDDFLVATDARRRELYWARYDGAGRRTEGPEVALPALIPDRGRPSAGEGPMLYPDLLPDGRGPAYPAAATLCRMAVTALETGDPDKVLHDPEPLYLRRPDAREPGEPKRVTR